MKRSDIMSITVVLFLIFPLFSWSPSLYGQDTTSQTPALPDNVSKIVTASCMPCHSSTGGLLSRTKLNFTNWTQYSPEKQKSKAEKIYTELKKGNMPPKSARETRPEIIPTSEQISIIKKWSESFDTEHN
jgi:hypothetical protein